MTNRVCITIDSDLESKIRQRQANLMVEHGKSVSFSSVINDILREKLK